MLHTPIYVTTQPTQNLKKYFLEPDVFRERYPTIIGTGPLSWWTYWTGVEFSVNAAATYSVKVDYIKSVPLLSTSSDIPTIPQSFEELLIVGAKMRIYEQKEDFDYAGQFQNKYADLEEAFITRYSLRQVDKQANAFFGRN